MKLKPCPFCGGMAFHRARKMNDEICYEVVAYCVNCKANINFNYTPAPWIKNPVGEAKRRGALAWNRRTAHETD